MENIENDDHADAFVRNLTNLPPCTSTISSTAIANEVRRLEKLITSDTSEPPKFSCPFCRRNFGLPQNMKRHMKMGTCRTRLSMQNGTPLENRCPKCNKIFSTAGFLKRHLLSVHPDDESASATKLDRQQCDGCLRNFSSFGNVQRHLRRGSCRHVCCHCSEKIPGEADLLSHVRQHLDNEFLTIPQLKALRRQKRLIGKSGSAQLPVRPKVPGAQLDFPDERSNSSNDSEHSQNSDQGLEARTLDYQQERTTNFDNTLIKYRIRPAGAEEQDMMLLFSNKRQQLTDNIRSEMRRFSGVKWYVCVTVKMTKYGADGEIKDTAKPVLRSLTQTVLTYDDIASQIDAAYFKVCDSLESFKAEGSGWTLDFIELVEQTIIRYQPLRGSCSTYTLPERLKRKSCLLSVIGAPSNSHECFRLSVLAGLHVPPEITGEIHFSELEQHGKDISFHGIEKHGERMSLTQLPEFEKLNSITVNVFGYENETFPLYISKNLDRNTKKHVNLLLVSNSKNPENDMHYCLIQSFSRLLCGEKLKRHGKLYYCVRCLNHKHSAKSLAEHTRICNQLQPANCETVSEENKWLQFKNYKRQVECPFVIVASFSCINSKLYDKSIPTEGKTVKERQLEPFAFAYFRISRGDSHQSEPVVYVGKNPEDTMMQFLKCMDEEQEKIAKILSTVVPLKLCETGIENLMKSNTFCYSCGVNLDDDKIRRCLDHCHLTGLARGYTCNKCNLMLKEPNFLPILTHDLSRFDARLIMSAVGKYGYQNINCIAQSCQNFISISINRCRYLDSKRFLNASLDALVESASSENGSDAFKYLRQFVQNEHVDLFTKKLVFCHEYLDEREKLNESFLPPISAFNDPLNDIEISVSDYEHVQRVWQAMEMKSLQDFVETYLLSEVLLLADVLSLFRRSMLDTFGLDPLQYYSLSGFSFDCALRKSETKVELMTCLEMHQTVENSIRGGLAFIGSPRYAVANNREMPEEYFDPEKPPCHLMFVDFNSLYLAIMKRKLPSFNFTWLTERQIENIDVMSIPESSDHGYIFEVDLICDPSAHDYLDSFPLCPENVTIKPEELSEYTKTMAEKCGISVEALGKIRKLCLTLTDKTHYLTHYLNLQFYLRHGMKLSKIHRAIRFTQSPWLDDFMTFVENKRRDAKSKFYQKLFKLIPNSVYGKLLESLRSHKNFKICTSAERLRKLVALPTFATLQELGTDVAAVQMNKERVVFNRPYLVGFCVLELAKLESYKFYYEFAKPAFRQGSANLLMHDTDSFLIKIDGFREVNSILKKHAHLFDFSGLKESDQMRSDRNRGKAGLLKFELGSEICCEFCALSPKCYSLKTDAGFKQTVKGSRKRYNHELYKKCLLEEECHEEKMGDVKCYGDKFYKVSVVRRVLNPVDFKRYYLNRTESLSFGHYRINRGAVPS